MTVAGWDALWQAIPRIRAKEHMAAYTVQVLASPHLNEDGQKTRDAILDNWRELVQYGRSWLRGQFKSPSDFSGPNTPPGTTRDDSWFPSVRAFGKKMAEILGSGLRE
jgi:hypothetical protein